MNILAIETACDLVGIAVGNEDGPRAGFCSLGNRRHCETVTPAIEHVLAQLSMTIKDIDVIAVDVGPGLFTGLRVGIATAKGLAIGLGVEVIGISSLDILARMAIEAGSCDTVVSVVDARRGEVFISGRAERVKGIQPEIDDPLGPHRCTPEQLVKELRSLIQMGEGKRGGKESKEKNILCVGDGAIRYADSLLEIDGVRVGGATLKVPDPLVLVLIASERLIAGAETLTPELLQPLYLREADVRINWTQRANSSEVTSENRA